jgi:hypothetical protein
VTDGQNVSGTLDDAGESDSIDDFSIDCSPGKAKGTGTKFSTWYSYRYGRTEKTYENSYMYENNRVTAEGGEVRQIAKAMPISAFGSEHARGAHAPRPCTTRSQRSTALLLKSIKLRTRTARGP